MNQAVKSCPKCGHVRAAGEAAPEWQCPKCGIAYAKYGAPSAVRAGPPAKELRVYHEGEMDAIDFKIHGAEAQFVEIELDRDRKSVV